MAIPVNVEDLLNKRKIESNRIEFKAGWNPDKIYHTICAFANDFDNIGGGYIIVGVEEENGVAKRPVIGVPIEQLDRIQKEMIGYDNKIEPYYLPRVDVQTIDGKPILTIWAPAGVNRPYNVRERVTAKQSECKWYVRSGTNTIEAKGEVLDELREMANRIPFDERGNEQIEITIEPKKISILSYAGPDRSISLEAIQKAERLKARRYRNRRLGDYLKELQLSEGQATGIPTIQDELRKNGSESARIETDEDRTYFLMEIPCREGFENTIEPSNEAINEAINKNKNALTVLLEVSKSPFIKRKVLLEQMNISKATLERTIELLSSEPLKLIEYQGSLKTGGYALTEKGIAFLMR